MARAAVIGASGGIGRALVASLAASGRFERVHALARAPLDAMDPRVRAGRIDLADEATIRQAAEAAGADGPLDLVVVASGLLHDDTVSPEKTIAALDPASLARLFAVNAIGPALAAKHFVPLLPCRGRAVFAALSARVGSISDNRLGGWYGYRASKAALNQILRTLAVETARTRPDAVILGLHPGTVATALSRPFRPGGTGDGLLSPAESAARLLAVMERVGPDGSGRVYAHDGSVVPP